MHLAQYFAQYSGSPGKNAKNSAPSTMKNRQQRSAAAAGSGERAHAENWLAPRADVGAMRLRNISPNRYPALAEKRIDAKAIIIRLALETEAWAFNPANLAAAIHIIRHAKHIEAQSSRRGEISRPNETKSAPTASSALRKQAVHAVQRPAAVFTQSRLNPLRPENREFIPGPTIKPPMQTNKQRQNRATKLSSICNMSI